MSRWTYRNQVIAIPRLAPWLLFAGVKLTEGLFHLRPRALKRLFWGSDIRVRRILRSSLAVGVRVVLAEVAQFLFATEFSPRGALDRIPVPRSAARAAPPPLAVQATRREPVLAAGVSTVIQAG